VAKLTEAQNKILDKMREGFDLYAYNGRYRYFEKGLYYSVCTASVEVLKDKGELVQDGFILKISPTKTT
jgi:hypothetical protein